MARKSNTKKVIVNTREESEIPVGEPEEAAATSDSIEDLLTSLDGMDGGKVRVHKLATKPGEGSMLCDDYAKADFNPYVIRETFGGGKYRLTVFDEQNRIVNSKQIALAELPKTPAAPTPAAQPAADTATHTVLSLLMKMLEGQQQTLTAILSKPAPAAPVGHSLTDILALIKASESKTDAVDTLLRGLEMGQRLGGGGDTGMLDIGKSALDAIKTIAAKQPATPAAPTMRRRATPNPAAAPLVEAPAPKPTPEADPVQLDIAKKLQWLTVTTRGLVQRAARYQQSQGRDCAPALYAEVFLNELPPFVTYDEVAARFHDASSIAQLAQLVPEVLTYGAWFEEFRKEVLDNLEPEESDEPHNPDMPANGAADATDLA
jgi:hypothetical protein